MKKTRYLLIDLLIAAILLLSACSPISNQDMDKNSKEFIIAFINSDSQRLKELSHPDYADNIDKIEQFKQDLENDGIDLKGEITKFDPYSRETAVYDSEYCGSINKSEYDLTVGGQNFDVTLVVLKNKDGFGICDFTLKPDNT